MVAPFGVAGSRVLRAAPATTPMLAAMRSCELPLVVVRELDLDQGLCLSAENGLYIPHSVQHPHNGKRPGSWIMDNEVGEHRPEFHRQRRQVLPEMARTGMGGEELKCPRNFLQHISRETRPAFRDKVVSNFA